MPAAPMKYIASTVTASQTTVQNNARKPPNTAVSSGSGVTSGKCITARHAASAVIAAALRNANARPSWR